MDDLSRSSCAIAFVVYCDRSYKATLDENVSNGSVLAVAIAKSKELARTCGLSSRQVDDYKKSLEEGVDQIIVRVYRFLLPRLYLAFPGLEKPFT